MLNFNIASYEENIHTNIRKITYNKYLIHCYKTNIQTNTHQMYTTIMLLLWIASLLTAHSAVECVATMQARYYHTYYVNCDFTTSLEYRN